MKAKFYIEPVVLKLRNYNPYREEFVLVAWHDICYKPVGTTWETLTCDGPYNVVHRAELVYRDKECAALLVSHWKQQDNQEEQIARELRVFKFINPIKSEET